MKKILVVDDDPDLRQLVQAGLAQQGFSVLAAPDAGEGLRTAFREHPDLMILDVMMPGMDGLETCRRFRELSDAPIIMLTALSRESDVVRGLNAGADDYVTKPFGMTELVARVQACLRRNTGNGAAQAKSSVIDIGELSVDLARHRVTVRGKGVDLTPTEFRLLSYLVRNRGSVIPHRTLLVEVWGPEYAEQYEYLHLYVRYLRRKIERDPSSPQILKTERGVGYYLDGG